MSKRAIQNPAAEGVLLARMQCLCEPARVRLLRLLERQELGVTDLCDVLQQPQSTVSRHLKVLAEQGWVFSRRSGTANLYHMVLDELDPGARKLWLVMREETAESPSARQDGLRLARRLRQRRDSAQSFFAGHAGQWDKLRRELYGTSFSTAAMLALLPSDWTVADLGCGTGAIAAELAGCVGKVIGIDQSEAMLAAAKERTAELRNVELRRGDLESLPLELASVDAAMLSIVLTYVAEPAAVLREAARVLRPGGRLVVVDLLRHEREDFRRQMGQQWPGFEPSELERMMSDAGLKGPKCRPIAPEKDVKGPALLLATAVK